MTIEEAIKARHSVRAYKEQPLTEDVVNVLEEKIAELNREGNLHMQLILNEPKAFQGTLAKYGKFRGVSNYIVVAGKKTDDLDERVGYYGEHLVLFAQTLGLNSCWVGLSYSKVPGTYVLEDGEKIACYIAIGYGETHIFAKDFKITTNKYETDCSTFCSVTDGCYSLWRPLGPTGRFPRKDSWSCS